MKKNKNIDVSKQVEFYLFRNGIDFNTIEFEGFKNNKR